MVINPINNLSKKGSPDPLKNINVHMLDVTSTNTIFSIEKDYNVIYQNIILFIVIYLVSKSIKITNKCTFNY